MLVLATGALWRGIETRAVLALALLLALGCAPPAEVAATPTLVVPEPHGEEMGALPKAAVPLLADGSLLVVDARRRLQLSGPLIACPAGVFFLRGSSVAREVQLPFPHGLDLCRTEHPGIVVPSTQASPLGPERIEANYLAVLACSSEPSAASSPGGPQAGRRRTRLPLAAFPTLGSTPGTCREVLGDGWRYPEEADFRGLSTGLITSLLHRLTAGTPEYDWARSLLALRPGGGFLVLRLTKAGPVLDDNVLRSTDEHVRRLARERGGGLSTDDLAGVKWTTGQPATMRCIRELSREELPAEAPFRHTACGEWQRFQSLTAGSRGGEGPAVQRLHEHAEELERGAPLDVTEVHAVLLEAAREVEQVRNAEATRQHRELQKELRDFLLGLPDAEGFRPDIVERVEQLAEQVLALAPEIPDLSRASGSIRALYAKLNREVRGAAPQLQPTLRQASRLAWAVEQFLRDGEAKEFVVPGPRRSCNCKPSDLQCAMLCAGD